MRYKFGIIPMRGQVFTMGHVNLLLETAKMADSIVIVLGSHNAASDIKNPFSSHMRKVMIERWIESEPRMADVPVQFHFLEDYQCDEEWKGKLAQIVIGLKCYPFEVVMVGSSKDFNVTERESWLHGISSVHIDPIQVVGKCISATRIRDVLFSNRSYEVLADQLQRFTDAGIIPESTRQYLYNYMTQYTVHHKRLVKEKAAIKTSINKFSRGKISHTGDAMVVRYKHFECMGVSLRIPQVLMVKRGGDVGNGLLALAGGFMEPRESFFEAATRELKEELNIDFSKKKPVCSVTYSEPDRDPRGRVITEAFRFDVEDYEVAELDIQAQDDAVGYCWKFVHELKKEFTFLDHYYIIQDLLKNEINREGV